MSAIPLTASTFNLQRQMLNKRLSRKVEKNLSELLKHIRIGSNPRKEFHRKEKLELKRQTERRKSCPEFIKEAVGQDRPVVDNNNMDCSLSPKPTNNNNITEEEHSDHPAMATIPMPGTPPLFFESPASSCGRRPRIREFVDSVELVLPVEQPEHEMLCRDPGQDEESDEDEDCFRGRIVLKKDYDCTHLLRKLNFKKHRRDTLV